MTDTAEIQKDVKKGHAGLSFLIDFGPLLVFFLTYRFSDPSANPLTATIKGTGAFMIAIIVALILSKVRLGKVSPMLWLSSILVIGFGALTIYFNDPVFIQVKPTIIYCFFAAVLFGGLLRGKPMLKYLLQAAFEGLDDDGWLKLSRNWAILFVVFAIANEILRRPEWFSFDTWLTAKVWGFTAVSFLFTMWQIPMLMRHGLSIEGSGKEEEEDKGTNM